MQTERERLFTSYRSIFRRYGNERPVLTTFWPQDYSRGTNRWIAGRYYTITRYVRAADPRFFEVWGREATVAEATGLLEKSPRISASDFISSPNTGTRVSSRRP